MDYYIGQIIYMALSGRRDLRDMLPCRGQLLAIQQNAALYSLIGNAYGGDVRTTFALPDLRPTVEGSSQKREWNSDELVPYIVVNGIYPSFE